MAARRAAVAAALVVLALLVLPGASAAEPEFTKTQTVTRNHLKADGTDDVVDSRTVTVRVSQTTNLRPRQLIDVTWTGARPTQGSVADTNNSAARFQEYPVVVMQCWGGDAANPLDPRNCWTQANDERSDDISWPGAANFPPWRVDRYATQRERRQLVDYAPDPVPANCPAPFNPVARHLPFRAAGGTVYYVNTQNSYTSACGPGLAPEMVSVDTESAPENTTYAWTKPDGTGGIKFQVYGAQDNLSLGCSTSTACSLVVIPIMGISCDVTGKALPPDDVADRPTDADRPASEANCTKKGQHQPGEVNPNPGFGTTDAAVTGLYWWAASNWRNRIEVPIRMGALTSVCDAGGGDSVDLLGSELMAQATLQWAPAFCTDPTLFPLRHVRMGEPQAKAAIAAGDGVAALVSLPPPEGYGETPVVHAPIAVTGFAVSYVADDKNGNAVGNLKLNPRLLAKLMTESYPGETTLREVLRKLPDNNPYKAMGANPNTIVEDKEFLALNPEFAWNRFSTWSSTLLALSGNADVMSALTGYVNADPEARAWLNGTPDPWGMVVNPGYKNIALPLPSWPLLDTFTSDDYPLYSRTGCRRDFEPDIQTKIDKVPKVPLGPLIASPLASLTSIAQRVTFANSNAHVLCQVQTTVTGEFAGVNMATIGRQAPGFRFMLGVTSLGDARFNQLNTAALQTTATVADPRKQFTDASGRTFVEPSDDSIRSAMKLAKPDAVTNTWPMVYNTLRTAPDAYPGTMPVYADVPTKNLPEGVGPKLARFLKFAVGSGQAQGFGNGQLPPGYLPLTAGNGLADLVNYTLKAADAVAAQEGALPTILPVAAPATTTANTGRSSSGSGGSGISSTPDTGARPSVGPSAGPSASSPPAPARPAGVTALLSSALAAWALPIILVAGVCCALAGAATRAVAYVVTWWRAP